MGIPASVMPRAKAVAVASARASDIACPHENTRESTVGFDLGALHGDAGESGGEGTGRPMGPGDVGSAAWSSE